MSYSNIILTSLPILSGFLRHSSQIRTHFHLPRGTCPTNLIVVDFITLVLSGKNYKL